MQIFPVRFALLNHGVTYKVLRSQSEHGSPGSDWRPDCYLSSAETLNQPTQRACSQPAPSLLRETEIQYIQNTNNSCVEAQRASSM